MTTASLNMLVVALSLSGLVLWAAWSDIRRWRIPNPVCGAIAALYPIALLAGLHPEPWWGGVAAAAATFLVGGGLFAFGVLGGGDVKMAAALALWAGTSGFAGFFVLTTLCGGVLALCAYLRPVLLPWILGPQTGGRVASVPYGVALAAGGLWIAYRLPAG